MELARRLTDVSEDAQETMHFFLRYNSVAFKGTLTVPTELTNDTPLQLTSF